MTDPVNLDEGSVVEYSLAELGFVLVFVLLLLSGWEINTNAAEIKKEAKALAELQRHLEIAEAENTQLKAVISKTPAGAQTFSDDFMFVKKADYLALQSKVQVARDFRANKDTAAPEEGGGKVGTVGFCTYEPPATGSDRVYGKSVPIGTLLVEEDGITLIEKNSSIQHRMFVDIAGEEYDTSLATDALDAWPLDKKLSPRQFLRIGARFIEIGELPSKKRVACRFGMDYFVPVYSKKSATMLKRVLEGSFYKNWEVDETEFSSRFPNYSQTLSLQTVMSPALDDGSSFIATTRENGETQAQAMPSTSVKILSKAMPVIPKIARRRGSSGLVEIVYSVSIYGRATEIVVTREEPSDENFGSAAVTALKKYKFKPATENGEPIESELRTLRFRF